MKLNKNIKIFINYFLGPVLFVWLSWSIYNQIKQQPNLEQSWIKIKESFSGPMIYYFLGVILLMIANWSLEAIKWKISVQHVQSVSFARSFRAVLSGLSFSVTTPNRIGEYFGRVLYMDEGNRLRVISLTILGSISQLIITLFFGITGLLLLRTELIQTELQLGSIWINIIIGGGTTALLVLTLFYFRIKWLVKWIEKLPGISKFAYLINELEHINATLLIRLLSVSLIRYLVFVIQYYLLFRFFGVDVNWWQSFWATAVVFFTMSVIPTVALFEIVQKVFVTREIFSIFTLNTLGVGFVTSSIWFINLVVPAAIGSLLIVSIKIFKKGNETN